MSREDQLVNRLIEYNSGGEYESTVAVEKHYNYYGDRGVVDLVVREPGSIHLYEIKSPSAISEATGANEIVRQFNRMREYYFQDRNLNVDWLVTFELCFTPNRACLEHIEENADIYNTVPETNSGLYVDHELTMITMRPLDSDGVMPAILFTGDLDYRDLPDGITTIPNNRLLSDWIMSESKFDF